MIELTFTEVTRLLNAQVAGKAPALFPPVGIDSRTIQPGQCFVALQGERFDGHDFANQALQRGASVVLHSRTLQTPAWRDRVFLQVQDTTAALQILAHYARKKWGRPLLAITGSIGKTTTREFVAALLGERFEVFKSKGNLNNHIGVPLSLLQLEAAHQVAVLELGMNHAGEIRSLSRMAAPQAALLTNVAPVHLEFFPSLDAIAEAKGEILESLPGRGKLFFNADDPRVTRLAQRYRGRKISFAVDSPADVQALEFSFTSVHRMRFRLQAFGEEFQATVPFVGKHFLYNIAAAVAAALCFDVSAGQVRRALGRLKPFPMRGRIFESQGVTIWDDSYNSSPQALAAVLETVSGIQGFGRKILVLGQMLELGRAARKLHRQAGGAVVKLNPDLLVTVGENAAYIAEGAVAAGFPRQRTRHFPDSEQAADLIFDYLRSGDFLLVKGSRGVRMEQVVQKIEEGQEA